MSDSEHDVFLHDGGGQVSQDAVHGVARLLSCNPLNNYKSGNDDDEVPKVLL